MSFHLWLSFFAACWVISLFPGAGAIASMSNGLSHGFFTWTLEYSRVATGTTASDFDCGNGVRNVA